MAKSVGQGYLLSLILVTGGGGKGKTSNPPFLWGGSVHLYSTPEWLRLLRRCQVTSRTSAGSVVGVLAEERSRCSGMGV